MTSRNPVGRPRKIAGQRPTSEPSVVEPLETPAAVAPTPEKAKKPKKPKKAKKPKKVRGGGLRVTLGLAIAAVLLLIVGLVEVIYLVRDDTPTISAQRPVVTGTLTQRAAVDTAAKSTEEILSTSYEDYDHQIDQATSKMTDTFAEQYRQTADGIKDQFIAQRTKLQFKVVAQGVVQASPEQVQALLFLNQYVEKTVDGQPKTDIAQYRALVTVVHTDQGWLVSNIETQ